MRIILFSLFFSLTSLASTEVTVGSKKFTESVILGEVLKQLASSSRVNAKHQAELGGTRILWNSLLAGNLDAYPEYTGTLLLEILSNEKPSSMSEVKKILKEKGIEISKPLGFNNTYAIGMKKEVAEKLKINSISDLKSHPDLVMGFGEEFIKRQDGWPNLKKAYDLPHAQLRGIDHDIAYRALQSEDIHVMDLYSTDAEIEYYQIKVLKDDRDFFPEYQSIILYRSDLKQKAPRFVESIQSLGGKISESKMIEMNAKAKIKKISESVIASEFIENTFNKEIKVVSETVFSQILRNTKEHLALVLKSLFAAILVSIPLGVISAKSKSLSQVILGGVGIIQTIPALALLVVLIQPLNLLGFSGIGDTPAIVALFLYSLLPIVRNTVTGLQQIVPSIQESASALGLTPWQKLIRVELPLASASILSGIKTAAVINVGFATLGALVGAGGYGQPILSGIRLDDYGLILQGALPAAILAVLVQIFFEISERWFIPKGLRSS